ncbi:MAG: GNAT family N-acetyltransferase [Alphaproteobacteria bacterium]|nr:GNAT family N-acetyltransferase [Alphaproteobacteria bacterium]
MHTRRLVLRPLRIEDARRIAELGGDWDVASMTARMPYPYTADTARQWIDETDPGEVIFGIECDGDLIGVTGFTPTEDRLSAEVGYWLGKPFWGNGYATEAARAIIEHCFKREGFSKLVCGHFADNPASARVIEKLGFAATGSSNWWCEARRLEILAVRYELPRPRPNWRRLMGFGKSSR